MATEYRLVGIWPSDQRDEDRRPSLAIEVGKTRTHARIRLDERAFDALLFRMLDIMQQERRRAREAEEKNR